MSNTIYKNRGVFLEKVIEKSNNQYLERDLALIDKIPTPMTGNTRKNTFRYTKKSTVDFTGVSQGQFVCFDAKQCSVPRFEFSRLQPHQESYLKHAHKQKGLAFILILFTKENELYKLTISEYVYLKNNLTRKSISLDWFRENKTQIKSKNGVYYDYLNIA
ncbi:Holliday junction resolvase RecU [Staphylococcus ureilyticus]|uniref:Holliday junction resolvase RecU n=1 Tax=Staphylococcus ureilyticus TaxID=94138 RepID=UPI0021D2A5AF|nr:Holliday junction resolvase RecU [Staphylococcus ureilyticus]UXS61015.1 Holliday junction resolvase RecU [Staphylococcus ureilyticus]